MADPVVTTPNPAAEAIAAAAAPVVEPVVETPAAEPPVEATPAVEPSAPAPEAVPDPDMATMDDDLFANEDLDSDDVDAFSTAPTEPPVEAPPAEITEAAPPAAIPPVPETPVAPPVEAAPVAAPVPEAAPVEPVMTQAQADQQFDTFRAEFEGAAARDMYALTTEDKAAIEEHGAEAFITERLPAAMAKVYTDATLTAIQRVTESMPQIFSQLAQQQSVNQASANTFFEEWPALREHEADCVKAGQTYRQLYPNATQAEFVRDVGAQVMVALRLQPAAAPGTVPAPAAAVAPAAPPFAPAGVAAPGAALASTDASKTHIQAVDEDLFENVDELDLD